ncbi:MAG TPA: ribulose-phosphate 3-epimerase [Gemmatales bacterium]|nr:ribulose-phosphate 3-epimerase [Gemmatales bacterium]HMP59644.1 ribulose-phosphate 3-epimerase [Gemmatales bacterium]
MPRAVKLAPSILGADFGHLAEQVRQAEAAGVDRLHLDVMDGHFVPNITFGPVVVEALKRVARVPLEVHLMIDSPDHYLAGFAAAGAGTLIVHTEAVVHLHRTLHHIRGLGLKAGVAINPGTPVAALDEIVAEADIVLVMSVNPGFAGQRFIESTLGKLQRIRALLDGRGLNCEVAVDGGVDAGTAPRVAAAGADVLVAASAIFAHPQGIQAGVQALRQSLEPLQRA